MPDDQALRPALVAQLARRPWWLAGFGIDVSGYACHAAALAFASLLFVQPLLVTGLLFALALRAAITGQPLRRGDLLAALALAGGLALFLLGVSPHGGNVTAPVSSWLVAGPVIVAAIGGCVAVGARQHGGRRAVMLGLAAGISFGVSAAFTKAFVHELGSGVFSMLGHWEPYGLAVTSIAGLILAQSSYQAGSLASSIAALYVAEPVAAAAVGIGLLDEQINTHGLGVQLGLLVAVAAMFFGVVRLARSTEAATTSERSRFRTFLDGHGAGASARQIAVEPRGPGPRLDAPRPADRRRG